MELFTIITTRLSIIPCALPTWNTPECISHKAISHPARVYHQGLHHPPMEILHIINRPICHRQAMRGLHAQALELCGMAGKRWRGLLRECRGGGGVNDSMGARKINGMGHGFGPNGMAAKSHHRSIDDDHRMHPPRHPPCKKMKCNDPKYLLLFFFSVSSPHCSVSYLFRQPVLVFHIRKRERGRGGREWAACLWRPLINFFLQQPSACLYFSYLNLPPPRTIALPVVCKVELLR
ncbi:hypothetical protein SAY87_019788 [Trapa incisa]|uniref:Uncharacterized protein n=1 Tax=Trapa incisa TaxID=236973 RepID=A0AAN7K2Y3_9MYRT|nr:hypothetical protein SAY87_019788 [Trapa incisa]